PAAATDSSGVPLAIERSPLDFADEAEASGVPADVSDPDPLAFDDAPSPHTADVAQWVIGYGLRLATMKCAESLEMKQAFADVVSAGIAKGMSEGLKHGVEHGHA
nr:hypothetical protein [Tanacetum cinerariifolium]